MAKDYAKQSKQQKSRKSSKAKQSSSKMWIATIVLLLLFVGALLYLKQHEALSVFNDRQYSKRPGKPTTQQQVVKPRFEFYTLLPKMDTGKQPQSIDVAPTRKHKPETATVEAPSQYLLQVASFKNFKEADRLKAQLLLLGFSADITTFANSGTKWFRVQTGPYSSQAAAEKMQNRLRQNNFKPILRKAT